MIIMLDVNLLWLQKACFEYFLLGGRCAATPVGLLAGMIHEPWTLIGHFFAVAFYGCFLIMTSSIWIPLNAWRTLTMLWTACRVILPVLYTELML